MAKKIVRGITDIKTINKQDFDTNNVNDLLSDGKHNYIHRKKSDGTEEYHNLTDNIKTIEATQNGLLTVRNFNNSTNSAKLTVHHDQAKSQLLGSPDQTINVQNGENGSAELTTVDVNPEKVLEHDNLLTDYGISKTTSGNTTTLGIEYSEVEEGFDLNDLKNGFVRGTNLINAPENNKWFFVSSMTAHNENVTDQRATEVYQDNTSYIRSKIGGVWGQWREQIGDKSAIDTLLEQKQNTIANNSSIGVDGAGLKQVYFGRTEYTVNDGYLETYYRSVGPNTNPTWAQEETNFIVKINKNVSNVSFELNTRDTTKFNSLITKYGQNNSVNINGCVFVLSGSSLTVSTPNNEDENYVITFSDLI